MNDSPADPTPSNPALFDLVCVGEALLELNQQGEGSLGQRAYREGHGGDASNVAIAAARQGARVAFVSAVGDDMAGHSFLDLWRRESVDSSAVVIDADHSTGLYFVSYDEAGHHFSYLRRGSAASHHVLDTVGRRIIEGSQILFASGISLGIADRAADATFDAMALARSAGRRVAFDTNFRPKLWPRQRASGVIQQGLRAADIAFPGLEDMRLLVEIADPDAIVDLCLSLGPRIVVLKMGPAGAIVATPNCRWRVTAFPCHPIDATGAGDTFCGSFLARLVAGSDLAAAARHAACAAALSTTGYGAVPPIPTLAAVVKALANTEG